MEGDAGSSGLVSVSVYRAATGMQPGSQSPCCTMSAGAFLALFHDLLVPPSGPWAPPHTRCTLAQVLSLGAFERPEPAATGFISGGALVVGAQSSTVARGTPPGCWSVNWQPMSALSPHVQRHRRLGASPDLLPAGPVPTA